jgi:hypothetical protein
MLMHVIGKLYAEGRGNASDFIVDTMWKSEEAVLEYLNERHLGRFGADCIARFILRDPNSVYQRILSISGASIVERERKLYARILNLSSAGLEEFRIAATSSLSDFLRVRAFNETLGPEDVLLDLPGRRLDMSGPIFMKLDNGDTKMIHELPGPVARLAGEFEGLVKRLRVFVNPRIVRKLDPNLPRLGRMEMIKLFEDAIPKRGAASQIQ